MAFRPRGRFWWGPVLSAGLWAVVGSLGGCERASSEDIAQVSGAIVGGELDTSHRGVVSLLKQVPEGYLPACSGTLLTPNLVLTAHHCVAELDSADGASIQCGTTEFGAVEPASSMIVSVEANVGSDGLDPFQVSRVWVPEGGSDVCGRDIALVLLAGSGVPASQAKPIEPNLTASLAKNDVFSAIGYGLQDPQDERGATAGHRMFVTDAKVFCEGAACGSALVKEGELLADSPVCSGDSGGPALDKNGRVSGVTSRGNGKCTLGIYTSVVAWRDFIVEKTFEAASAGHYTAPAWTSQPPAGFDPDTSMAGSGGTTSLGDNSGTPVIAGSSASGGSRGLPAIDPLGLSCTGSCPGSYVCWAADSEPPGICVPKCSAAQDSCPADYECDPELGACLRSADLPQPKLERSGGCSVVAQGAPAPALSGWWLGLFACGWWGARRARPRASGT